jgi:hypothetical protein
MLARNFPVARLGCRCGETGYRRRAHGAAAMAVAGALAGGRKRRKEKVWVGSYRGRSRGGARGSGRPWHEQRRAAEDRHQRRVTEGDTEETDRWAQVYFKFNLDSV